jgi:peptidoglycan/xylan/chitin deacetylase (PgdA/CDA1 family)
LRARLVFPTLIAAAGGALLVSHARSPRPSAAPPAAAAAAEQASALPVVESQSPPLVAVDFSPRGVRVDLDTPVWAELERDADRPRVERSFSIDPPSAGRFEWLDARSFRFVPERWLPGRVYRVRAGGMSWQFRTRVPPPAAIVPGEGRPIVLSFDDGPHDRRQADRLLDTLAAHGAKVLLFPTGRWARQRKDWVERAVRDGHRVCNHTLSHKNLTLPSVTDAEVRYEIENGAGDGSCRYFRPPLLGVDRRVERIARELGYVLFYWDIDSRDWQDTPAEDVENLVLGAAKPGAVVLLHMHAAGTLGALPRMLERLQGAGYVITHEGVSPPRSPLASTGRAESVIPDDEALARSKSPTPL